MKKRWLLCCSLLCLTPWIAQGDTTALSFTGYFANNNGNPYTLGYEFSPNRVISVTALSYFDANNDGLLGVHTVGIWNASGTLLASTTIPAATVATLQDGFRYVTLPTALTLSAGQNYFVGGTSGSPTSLDPYAQTVTGITIGSAINYVATAQANSPNSSTLTFPNDTSDGTNPSTGFYGGSFLYTAVPEPSTLSCLLAAGGGLALAAVGRRSWLARGRS